MSISKSAARAIADVTTGTILATVEIAAPPERVFRALTTDDITKWWGSPELYRTTAFTGDVRPGGRWRSDGVGADGKAFSVEGEYREIDPPRKLVQTWKAAWDGGNETTITYRLEAIEGGTRLTLRHDGFGGRADSCRGHGEGWQRVFGWLAKYLAPVPEASGEAYYFCRLIPPRPTFAIDMNAEEAETMRAHAGYWRTLLEKGDVVVFGPVGDPKGPWGLGVVKAANEAAINAFRDGDPAIRSGRGFRYEILPMLKAVVRD
jgi:uncharacterized protein YndB with AHSA1/START domain/uncharacterized protein YciI